MARRNYFDLVHAVTLRAINAFTDEELHFRPRPGMRSVRELIFHIYCQERVLAEAAQQGRFSLEAAKRSNPEDDLGASDCAKLVTVGDAREYADACHQAADKIFRAMSDEEIGRPIESPFGAQPAWQFFTFAYDEHWHHRGQLYTYLRLLGKEPPNLYDYAG